MAIDGASEVDGSRVGVSEEVLVNLVALAIGGFVSFSLLIWDFICYLPDEIRLIKDFRTVDWRLPDPIAFFLVRYSALAFSIVTLFNLTLKTDTCQLVASLTQIFTICVVSANGILTATRTIALWSNDSAVVSLLSTLYVAMVGSWIATTTQYRATNSRATPLPAFGTNCSMVELPPWNPVNYGSSTLFFSTTFFLAMYRLVTQRTERVLNTGLTPINRACIWYLMVNASASTALFIVFVNWHPQWTTPSAKRIAAPFFVVLIAAMSQRIYLNNHADHILRGRHVAELTDFPKRPEGPWLGGGRWSFAPMRKSTPQPETNMSSYPCPPIPPLCVPLSPIPRQHIISLNSAKTSYTSASISSSIPKTPSSSKWSSDMESISINPATSPSSATESMFSNAMLSPVSTIGFNSIPESPAVRPVSWSRKFKKGRKQQRRTGSSFSSFGASSQPTSPVKPLHDRLPSLKSGWVS